MEDDRVLTADDFEFRRCVREFPPVLVIHCPRRSAVGRLRDAAAGYCIVDWSNDSACWTDTNFRVGDLTDQQFDCGFDGTP